jgi:hypothetical protein
MNADVRCNILRQTAVVLWVVIIVCLALSPAILNAATPLASIEVSSDTTVTLTTQTLGDESVAKDDLAATGTVALVSLGPLPASADVDAYQRLPGGDQLFSVDTTVDLGFPATPADVVRWDGVAYSQDFDASAYGVPGNANVDAMTREWAQGDLLLSFDTTMELAGTLVEDEDLVRFDGLNFTLFFDGTAVGVPATLDLDAAYLLFNGHLLLSFDGSGTIAGVALDDEDVLEYDPTLGIWELAYDGSAQHADWSTADLDALHASGDIDGDGIPDSSDNCPDEANADQADKDGNGVGDVCEPPQVTGIWTSAPVVMGDTVSLFVFGDYFDLTGVTQVFVSGIQQFLVQPVTSEMLIVRVTVEPAMIGGPVTVTTSEGSAISVTNFGDPLTGLNITGVWPVTVTNGQWTSIFVFGSEFDTTPGGTQVSINGVPQPIVAAVTPDMLIVRALASPAIAGPVTVTTSAGSVTSTEDLIIVP